MLKASSVYNDVIYLLRKSFDVVFFVWVENYTTLLVLAWGLLCYMFKHKFIVS